MLAIWWAWIDNAWITNWLDPDRAPVRMLLFALMFGGLVVSASIPKAFADRGLAFGLAYAAIEITPKFFMLWALKHHDRGQPPQLRAHHGAGAARARRSGPPAASRDPQTRLAVWALALAIDTASPLVGFWVPGLGRSTTADWNVEGDHLAERCAPVHHHRARRVDPDHRGDLRGPALDRRRPARPSPTRSSAASRCGWSISTSGRSAPAR